MTRSPRRSLPRASWIGRSLAMLAAATTAFALTAVPAGAQPAGPPPGDDVPLPATCPAVINPPDAGVGGLAGGYHLPNTAYIVGGVLSDGSSVATGLTASTCGVFTFPYWPQLPDPVPGAPPINPSIPEDATIIPPSQTNLTDHGNLTLGGTLPSGTIALFSGGPSEAVVRQAPRPDGSIDIDLKTMLLSTISVGLSGLPSLAVCWVGGTQNAGAPLPAGITPPGGAPPTPGVDPAVTYLSTASDPSLTPPGGKPPQPVRGPLPSATAIVVAQPFTLNIGSCNVAATTTLPIIGSIINTTFQAVLEQTLVPNGGRFSAPFYLSLSLT